MTEPALISGLQKGQQAAFTMLFDLYKDTIYNTALGMVQHEQDAQNILQEVLLKIFEKINGFKREAALSTWIYKITVSQSLDFLRKKNRLKKVETTTGKDDFSQADFNHPGIIAAQKENAAILFKAISKLPENQMTAFILQKTEGLAQAQIAAIMELSESAVESLLSRAKANLKTSLSNYYNHG